MKLGIDIDGVLYPWDMVAREQIEYGHVYGMPHELTERQVQELWKGSWTYIEEIIGKENWDWFWANQNMLETYLSGRNDYGQEQWEAVATLSQKHETYLLTARPRDCWWQTYEWVARQHPRTQLQGVLHATNKVKTAEGLSLDVLVDDRPSQLKQFRNHALANHHRGVLVYGVRRPWNTKLHNDLNITWVDGVADLLKEEWA